LAGRKFDEFTHFEHLAKKVWQMNRFSQKVMIVSRNLDGWMIHQIRQTFPLYSMCYVF